MTPPITTAATLGEDNGILASGSLASPLIPSHFLCRLVVIAAMSTHSGTASPRRGKHEGGGLPPNHLNVPNKYVGLLMHPISTTAKMDHGRTRSDRPRWTRSGLGTIECWSGDTVSQSKTARGAAPLREAVSTWRPPTSLPGIQSRVFSRSPPCAPDCAALGFSSWWHATLSL
jgi:hypothetical protein